MGQSRYISHNGWSPFCGTTSFTSWQYTPITCSLTQSGVFQHIQSSSTNQRGLWLFCPSHVFFNLISVKFLPWLNPTTTKPSSPEILNNLRRAWDNSRIKVGSLVFAITWTATFRRCQFFKKYFATEIASFPRRMFVRAHFTKCRSLKMKKDCGQFL